MTRERWQQVEELYHLAVERTPDDRARFLSDVCSDRELRAEVETLLTETAATQFLDAPAWERGASLLIPETARFAEGAILADRYCIVAPIGRGGMGEVYRALDLILGQTVALKFLPESLTDDPRALNRLYVEVRLARQVSHPNVCRVYDIAEADGLRFLTMEYVDGEDLWSHLRRCAPLPLDRAIAIARRICAGLAAAHECGVLHRDLKPANIMIDAQAGVRITDFGLAVPGGPVDPGDIRSGTPAYMAPEQLAGEAVSVQSDIYSLGLVLYEVFGGQPLFRSGSAAELLKRKLEAEPPPLAVELGVPAEIERAVRRCLAPDPQARPTSASSVAVAIGGGDALSPVVAAGEMPAPELVALSGGRRGLAFGPALACLATVVASLSIFALLGPRVNILGQARIDSPAVLERTTREKLKALGIDVEPMHRAEGFAYDMEAVRRHFDPSALYYWALADADRIIPRQGASIIAPYDPPRTEPATVSTRWNRTGRLLFLEAEPPPSAPAAGSNIDLWSRLFVAAGLPMAAFRAEEPQWIRAPAWDARAAWTGVYPDAQRTPVRIEAAAWRGRPVFFEIIPAWRHKATRAEEPQLIRAPQIAAFLLVFGISAVFVRRNIRRGIGDRRGAFRIAATIFAAELILWACTAIHVAEAAEFVFLGMALATSLLFAFGYWAIYLALEPFVRRRWPHALISWTRVLAGRIRDPLVGSDLLTGAAFGSAAAAFTTIVLLRAQAPHAFRLPYLIALSSPKGALAHWLGCMLDALLRILFLFFLTFLMKYFCRKDWLAAVGVVAGMVAVTFAVDVPVNPLSPVLVVAINGLLGAMMVWLLLRRGLFPAVVAGFTCLLLFTLPVRAHISDPGAKSSLLLLAGIGVLAVLGFNSSSSGREPRAL